MSKFQHRLELSRKKKTRFFLSFSSKKEMKESETVEVKAHFRLPPGGDSKTFLFCQKLRFCNQRLFNQVILSRRRHDAICGRFDFSLQFFKERENIKGERERPIEHLNRKRRPTRSYGTSRSMTLRTSSHLISLTIQYPIYFFFPFLLFICFSSISLGRHSRRPAASS